MANPETLVPGAHKLTLEEQSKGGKASAKKRKEKKSFREAAMWALEMKVNLTTNEETQVITQYQAIVLELLKEAKDKNNKDHLAALQMLMSMIGETPRMQEVDLRRLELEMKKQAQEADSW